MKQKFVILITFAIVMLNALPMSADITVSGNYRLELNEITTPTIISQETEYNISTYLDYTEATVNLMLAKHMDLTTGVVFHSITHDLSLYSLETSLSSYYWAIAALANEYSRTNNETYKLAVSRVANKMVEIFFDTIYPGFCTTQYAEEYELAVSKRPGIQAYAYWALEIAESTNTSLDFTTEKESALRCLTDTLYDPINGGFYFYTLRNGSLDVPLSYQLDYEVYPNDGKRLDHLALAATLLFEVGSSLGNTTMLNMADRALSFMITKMRYVRFLDSKFTGLKLAVNRTGGAVTVQPKDRVGHSVVTDINAIAIRALLEGYMTTGNQTYLDTANEVFEALFTYNWDGAKGGWFAETVDGEPYDPLYDPIDNPDAKYYKYSEIQFQMILALEALYEVTDSIYPIRMIIDTLELILDHLWDFGDEGFVSNGNQVWDVLDEDWGIHYTSVQGQAVLGLERVWSYGLPIVSHIRITPTNPRPKDSIYFSATVLDDDGIDTVFINYTMRLGENETNGMFPLIAHPTISGVFNNTLDALENSTEVNFEVFANDTTGRIFIAGSYYFMVRFDIFPPVVALNAIYPTGSIYAGDDITVDIESYEFPVQSHTNSCEFVWRTVDTPFFFENMTPTGVIDDKIIWRIHLGSFNGGDRISFFARVMDEAGNIGESRVYLLTILTPVINISPISAFQIAAAVGLVSAPGVGYLYTKRRKAGYKEAQREGKKDAKRRARQRGTSRRRKQR